MRALVPALLLSLLAAAAAQAQTDPYQWVGPTSVAFDGRGNGLGFVGMSTQCRADYGAGARMCESAEILRSDTLDLNAMPTEGCWVRPSWAHANGLFLDEAGSWDNECYRSSNVTPLSVTERDPP